MTSFTLSSNMGGVGDHHQIEGPQVEDHQAADHQVEDQQAEGRPDEEPPPPPPSFSSSFIVGFSASVRAPRSCCRGVPGG